MMPRLEVWQSLSKWAEIDSWLNDCMTVILARHGWPHDLAALTFQGQRSVP